MNVYDDPCFHLLHADMQVPEYGRVKKDSSGISNWLVHNGQKWVHNWTMMGALLLRKELFEERKKRLHELNCCANPVKAIMYTSMRPVLRSGAYLNIV